MQLDVCVGREIAIAAKTILPLDTFHFNYLMSSGMMAHKLQQVNVRHAKVHWEKRWE